MWNNTGGIVIYGKGDDVYGDDCHDLYGDERYNPWRVMSLMIFLQDMQQSELLKFWSILA